jgi:putative membrane-bound dehydrogenase-like protein
MGEAPMPRDLEIPLHDESLMVQRLISGWVRKSMPNAIPRIVLSVVFLLLGGEALAQQPAGSPATKPAGAGVLPVGDDGKPLNTDFETGDLRDWTVLNGQAFTGQPIKGDTVNARRGDLHSKHAGNYWIGTFEVREDGPRGILQSRPFKATHPWAKFLIGGGSNDEGVDIILADSGKLFFHAAGDNREEMEPVAVDLRPIQGQNILIRINDDHSFSWGHVNFDDFKFYDSEPQVPKRIMLTPDTVANAGLSPAEAVKAITMPPGFSATLFAGEPDVHQPIAFTMDDRGRLWVAEAYTYPIRAKEGEGKDDILIFEDTDGDGKFDKRTVFATGLNLVSGLEVGFGGVYVGAAPYLMFIPDKDHDDKPDGPPQILLDGWAYQDTHETLNGFNWGPDGWLYGCQGVFTFSKVGKPGTADKDRVPLNCCVWRYHPTRHVFEVYAEGTSNPWGIDWNDVGQPFITACVIPHLYHVIEGAHYQRQAGSHYNPYVYDDIKTIADHVHWLGDKGPHAGNEKSGSAGGGHAHCGAMIYLGDSWPASFRDNIIMANIHGNRLNEDLLEQTGSGYVGHHGKDPVLMNDKWSRPINFRYGPDGSVYMIDWYDRQACHNPVTEIWDRTNGRIFKLIYNNQKAVQVDLAKLSNDELVKLQASPNDWYVRHARRLLQEREAGKEVGPKLIEMLNTEKDAPKKLRALWALYTSGGLTPDVIAQQLKAADPYVRGWAIQLAGDNVGPLNLTGPFSSRPLPEGARGVDTRLTTATPHPNPLPEGEGTGGRLAEMAKSDPSPIVRLYIASALQRMPVADRWPILEALVAHSEDATDHNLPLMYWWAAEAAVAADVDHGISLAKQSKIPLIREYIARRICAVATADAKGDVTKVNRAPLDALAKLLIDTSDEAFRLEVLNGMSDGLRGWPLLPAPANWSAVYDKCVAATASAVSPQLVSRTQELSVIFGEEKALAGLRTTVSNKDANLAERRKAIEALVGAKDVKIVPVLQSLVADASLRNTAIRGLAAFDDEKTPDLILKNYADFDTPTKVDALNTLASRSSYAKLLMAAVQKGTLPKTDVTAATLRQLAAIEDPAVKSWLEQTFGSVHQTPQAKLDEIAKWKESFARKSWADRSDPQHGRAIFAKTCMQCHTLFDVGGHVGPDLTGSNRADLGYLLTNVVDPSAVIGKDYLLSVIKLKDKRVLSGIIKKDDGNSILLQTESEQITIPKADITLQKQQPISMMPEGLLAGLKKDEVRDLVAYLGSPKQVPMLASAQNAATLFNGKDLSGWVGDTSLWSVENGEIVGRTTGLKKNEFLFSQMACTDFRLTFKIKLVKNEGNSGMQFRSEALPDGEAKGYQADVGVGWWGKLYEENGRAILSDKLGESFVKPGEWNDYEILAAGNHIVTKINGQPCVDLQDAAGAKRGVFGIQLHAGGPTEVRVKDLKLEVDPNDAGPAAAK